MSWKCYLVRYELQSPLHIGYLQIGYLKRTRYYIPARALWGSVTAALTQSDFGSDNVEKGNYESVGEWVKRNFAFSYFFVTLCDDLLNPNYTDKGIILGEGGINTFEFERSYISSSIATAIDPQVRSAESGSLHEIELINPVSQNGEPTVVSGWIFLSDEALEVLSKDDEWGAYIGNLRVGGERRYGFGRMKCISKVPCETMKKYHLDLNSFRPIVNVPEGSPVLAHVPITVREISGDIEPMVGRETKSDSSRFGMTLTNGNVCWVPGSVVSKDIDFIIEEGDGIWSTLNSSG